MPYPDHSIPPQRLLLTLQARLPGMQNGKGTWRRAPNFDFGDHRQQTALPEPGWALPGSIEWLDAVEALLASKEKG